MPHSLLHTVGHVVWVARNERRRGLPLLTEYSRLKVRELVARARDGEGRGRASILGMDVEFFDHYWLVEMFEDIFLRRQYYFRTESEQPVIVDVGGNIGLGVLYFKWLYPDSQVTVFEPDPGAFCVLERNVSANGLTGVTLMNAAVTEAGESAYLFRNEATPGSPQMSTSSERGGGAGIAVPATRLSEHVEATIDFLKVDAEGAEHGIVRDLDVTGKLPLVRRLTIEYHHHLDPERDELSELLAALERHGFGYQLEARLDGPPGARERHFQNVLVTAYRKGGGEPGGRGSA